MGGYTFRLFKESPSFIGGVASLMDLSHPRDKYHYSRSDAAADCESIQADWMAIGNDMKSAISEYEQEKEESLAKSGR